MIFYEHSDTDSKWGGNLSRRLTTEISEMVIKVVEVAYPPTKVSPAPVVSSEV